MIARNKHGELIQWPGDLVYQDGKWRLISVGTKNVNGTQEFWIEKVDHRIRLGAVTFEEARDLLKESIRYEEDNPT